jgi:hypothetical protein
MGSSSVGPYGHATRSAVRASGRSDASTAAHEMDDPNSVEKETTKTPNPMGYGVNEETRPTYYACTGWMHLLCAIVYGQAQIFLTGANGGPTSTATSGSNLIEH